MSTLPNTAMETSAHTLTDQSQAAMAALRTGELLIIPTDTVYGLAADADNNAAIARLYALKQRPANQPFSLLVSDLCMAERYGVFDGRAHALAAHFWPGAMTLIVPMKAQAPLCAKALAGGTTIGLRIPAHAGLRALIAAFDGALAAPSANIAGAPPPSDFGQVSPDVLCGAALAINDGPCAIGSASSLIDVSKKEVRLLRSGDVSRGAIDEILATLCA